MERGEWPLVGRDGLLAEAGEALAAGSGVVLVGPRGVGRSRLARELADRRFGAGRSLCITGSVGARAIPLAPLGALLEDADLDSGPRTLRRAGDRLAAAARSGGIVVDDAHLLDGPSAHVIGRAARDDVPFVITSVLGASVPEEIGSLWRDGTVSRFDVAPLSENDVDRLLCRVFDAVVDRAAVHRLLRLTAGNVLLLREVVLGAVAAGDLHEERGMWRITDELTVPDRAAELVIDRLGDLDENERTVLELVALAEPIPVDPVVALADRGAVERLHVAGLVLDDRSGVRRMLRSGLPVVSEVIRSRTSAVRLDARREALADALAATGLRREDDRLIVATLRLDAGLPADARAMLAAARSAWRRGDARLAERLARRAADHDDAAEAGYLLAEALADQGRFAEARDVLVQLPERLTDPSLLVAVAQMLALLSLAVFDDPEGALVHVERAAEGVAADPDATAELVALQGQLHLHLGDPAGALAKVQALGTQNEGLVRARIDTILFPALSTLGRFDEVTASGEAAAANAERCADRVPSAAMWIDIPRFYALLYGTGPESARAFAEDRRQRHLAGGLVGPRGTWATAVGIAAALEGRLDEAERSLAEAAADLADYDNGGRRIACWHLAAVRASLASGLEGAERALDDASRAHAGSGPSDIDSHRAGAAVAARRGARAAALAELDRGYRAARERNHVVLALLVLLDAVRLGDPVWAMTRIRELSDVDGALFPIVARWSAAAASRDGAALFAVASDLHGHDFDLWALEAACSAARELARVGAGTAEAVQLATRLLERCPHVATPLVAAGLGLDPLTPRERETAVLAAAGHGDKAIAAELGISARTVHAHLRAVYRKLGIPGRTALPDRL